MATVTMPADVVKQLRDGFDSGLTRPLSWRRTQLRQLLRMLREHEPAWLGALAADLSKPPIEGWVTEIGAVTSELEGALRHLGRWMEPRKVPVPVRLGVGRARVVPEPLGVVLVISP